MDSSIRVLHVDDEADFGAVVADFLEATDDRIEVVTTTRVADALDRLALGGVDCVVSDYDMPETDGVAFLEIVRERFDDLPFVLFTGRGSEEIASTAISAGVTDYLQKETGTDQYAVLANRIVNAVSKWRAESSLERRAHQQRVVAELGRKGLAGTDLATLFDAAVERVANALGNEFASVLKWRPQEDGFHLQAGVSWEPGLVEEASVDGGPHTQAGHTLRSEAPVLVERFETDSRFDGPPFLAEHDVVSGISVIVGDPDHPWGVLGTHSGEPRRFSGDDVHFVQSVANVLADTIDRQAHERELEQATDHMRLALQGANAWVWEWDLDEESITQSAVTAMLGADGEQATRSVEEFLDMVHPEDREAYLENVERAVESGEPYRQEFRSIQDGETRWIESRGQLFQDEAGGTRRLIGIGTDVTDRKKRERERMLMQRALDQSGEAVFISDPDTAEIEFVNDTACEQRGYERAELLDMTVLDIQPHISDIDEWRAHIERHREGGHGLFEGSHVRADGSQFPVEVNTGLVEIDGEEYLIGIVRDVTERRDRERELKEQVDRLDEFARIISHDLRNPLNVAGGRVRLAIDTGEEDHLDVATQALDRMGTLIEDLLRLAREGESGSERAAVDLATVAESCWRTVETRRAALRVEAECVLRAEEFRLKQLLENLFHNAVEHGGEDVTVTVGRLDGGFYVEDDGPGFPRRVRERLAEGDPVTAGEGARFGLSIVHRIAVAHGWTVDVTEGEHGGARLAFTGVEFVT